MKLHTHPSDFKDAITAAAQGLGIREAFIEKDYWLSFALKNLSESKFKDQAVFKGGTSLSKAHGIISRFSEDIDIVILDAESLKSNQIKKLLKAIERQMMQEPLAESSDHPLMSKGSRFRKSAYHVGSFCTAWISSNGFRNYLF